MAVPTTKPTRGFQTVGDRKPPNRSDHVWLRRKDGNWICVLCGGMTEEPPPYPTPDDWSPRVYLKLTDEYRDLSPGPEPCHYAGGPK